ncbi:MAG: hypothetical protein AB7O60_07555 [Variibacter sp.]
MVRRSALMRLVGQGFEIRVDLPEGLIGDDYEARAEAFYAADRREYGYIDPKAEIEATDWYVVTTLAPERIKSSFRAQERFGACVERRSSAGALRVFSGAWRMDFVPGCRSLCDAPERGHRRAGFNRRTRIHDGHFARRHSFVERSRKLNHRNQRTKLMTKPMQPARAQTTVDLSH